MGRRPNVSHLVGAAIEAIERAVRAELVAKVEHALARERGRARRRLDEVMPPDEERFVRLSYHAALAEFEVQYWRALARKCGHNLSEMARRSGVDRSNLRRTLARRGIKRPSAPFEIATRETRATRQRPPKAPAKPAPAKPRKRVSQAKSSVAASRAVVDLSRRVLDFVREHPGKDIDGIAVALRVSADDLRLPITRLIAARMIEPAKERGRVCYRVAQQRRHSSGASAE